MRTCWICLGIGRVQGPLHGTECPNKHCPFRKNACPPRGLLGDEVELVWVSDKEITCDRPR